LVVGNKTAEESSKFFDDLLDKDHAALLYNPAPQNRSSINLK